MKAETLEKAVSRMGKKDFIEMAKRYTQRYAENHKGKNELEKKCIKNGYLIMKTEKIFPDCSENQRGKLHIFALDFNIVHHKGGFIMIA